MGSVLQSLNLELTPASFGVWLGMARQLRFQYPGAVYHIMARGAGGKQLFLGKDDHLTDPEGSQSAAGVGKARARTRHATGDAGRLKLNSQIDNKTKAP